MAYKDKEKQKAFQRVWKREQNLKAKLKAVEMLGGKCSAEDCEVTDFRCLHIDHINPVLRKTSGVTSGINNSYLVTRGKLTTQEVQLLCANHHAIKTYDVDRLLFDNYLGL